MRMESLATAKERSLTPIDTAFSPAMERLADGEGRPLPRRGLRAVAEWKRKTGVGSQVGLAWQRSGPFIEVMASNP
jgi:hypothetical protein